MKIPAAWPPLSRFDTQEQIEARRERLIADWHKGCQMEDNAYSGGIAPEFPEDDERQTD